MTEAMKALQDVIDGKVERISKPGKWRVYLNEDGSAVLEVFKKDATKAD